MQRNTLKEKLKAGECVYGTSLEDCLDPEMAVVLAAAGLDFFFTDTEHCPATFAEIQRLCRAGLQRRLGRLCRLPQGQQRIVRTSSNVKSPRSSGQDRGLFTFDDQPRRRVPR